MCKFTMSSSAVLITILRLWINSSYENTTNVALTVLGNCPTTVLYSGCAQNMYNTTPPQEQHLFPFSRKDPHPLTKCGFNMQHVDQKERRVTAQMSTDICLELT